MGRGGRALRGDRRRFRLRGARVRQRRGRVGQLLLGGPRQPPRAARAAGRRHARQRGGWPAQLRRPAQGVHPDAGLEPRPARPARLPGDVDRRAGQLAIRQRLQGPVGACSCGPPRAARRSRGTCSPAPGASSWPSWRSGHRTRAAASRFRYRRTQSHRPQSRQVLNHSPVNHGRVPEMPARITARPGGPAEITAPRWAPATRRRSRGASTPPPTSPPSTAATSSTGRPPSASATTCGTHGFAVAEAMDTAQRGMGLPWWLARELIASTAERAAARRAAGRFAGIACGAGTDHLADRHEDRTPSPAIIDAYTAQLEFVQSAGAGVILMASRALAAAARGPRDYLDVYGALLKQASQPVILHWLGEAFDPALRGYWGGADFESAAATVLELIDQAGDQIDGIKLSVLDADTGDRAAAQAPGRDPALHRRRLRLRRPDQRRRRRPQRRAARRVRRGHRARPPPRCTPSTPATWPATRPRSARRSRSAASSSRRRPTTTRPAWPSWPGSTASSRASRCSTGSSASGRPRT